jgi:hypothetical protein
MVGRVGDQERAFERNCMTTRRSALPVRMSYRVNVRSEPTLARTDGSARLNRTEDTVSLEVGKVRFDTGADLSTGQQCTMSIQLESRTLFRPRSVQCWRRWRRVGRSGGDQLS